MRFITLMLLSLCLCGCASTKASHQSPVAHTHNSVATVLLPDGQSFAANNMNTLAVWANYEKQQPAWQETKFLNAAAKRSTYPLFTAVREAALQYWSSLKGNAISYGDAAGELVYRRMAAHALNRWYGHPIAFQPKDIVFTVGGTTALHAIFFAIHHLYAAKKIVTPVPFYPVYTGYRAGGFRNHLHLVDLSNSGYRLTAQALQESLAGVAAHQIGAFLFCDPSNPTGFAVDLQQWQRIAQVLAQYPEVPIVLDETYAALAFNNQHGSLLQAAPDLQNRIVLLRSATKEFAAAGERLALVATKHAAMAQKIIDFTAELYIHPPRSAQYVYAHALQAFSRSHSADLSRFYQTRNNYAYQLLQQRGLQVNGKPHATFYLLANLKHLMGLALHPQAARVLRKTHIDSDVAIAYHLLFSQGVALAPLSFFGLDPQAGILRITCCDDQKTLQMLINRLPAATNSS
ncbi:MAG: pyridoxal phosphate-dependent aminotransferase [Myxococcota bacterium]